jgi:hypothetical protein
MPSRKPDFHDVLKYGSQMIDPNFNPGKANTDAKSTTTYNPYSVKDYR